MSPHLIRKLACSAALTAVGFMPLPTVHADDDTTTDVVAAPAIQTYEINRRNVVKIDRDRRVDAMREVVRSAEEQAEGQPADSAAAKSLEQAQALLQRVVMFQAGEETAGKLEKAAFLGVATSPPSVVLRRQLKLVDGVGLIVDYVEPDSPAAAAGLQPFDVAVRLNNQVLINPQQLAVLVRTFDAGQEVKLTVLREGKTLEMNVKLIERAAKPIDRVLFGMMPDDVRPFERGDEVRVTIFDLEGPGKATPKQTIVGQAGEIRLPYLKRPVRAAGLTQLALQQAIVGAYRTENVLESANVAVERLGRSRPQFVVEPMRTIQQNDTVMLTLHDVEGPGIATVKQARIGPSGTVELPRLAKPVSALGCTPKELEKSVLDLYRSAGMAPTGKVGVSVSAPVYASPADAPQNQ